MSEQENRPVRRISGRLTDTIKEEDVQEVQEMFSPRRPVRTEKTETVSEKITKKTEIRPEQKVVRPEQKVVRPEQKIVRPERRGGTEKPAAALNSEYTGKRRRIQENEAKMRTLWGTLGILTVLLIAAIIYEVVLGHGIRQTGSERMASQTDDIIVILNETEAETETETETGTETETESEMEG